MRDLARFYAALADENRLRLLHLLKEGEVCVCHLQAVLQTNQPKISRHLAYLRKAGLVDSRKEGRWMHYRLRALDEDLAMILAETLSRLGKEKVIKLDQKRLGRVVCCS